MVDVILIGAGAGGGGACSGTGANANVGSPGGGAGCFMYVPSYPATPNGTISYTIGTSGAGGVASGTTAAAFNGSAGGNTTFGGLVAPGGGVRIGAQGSTVDYTNKGAFGVFMHFPYSSNQGGNYLQSTTASYAAYDATALGFPIGVPGAQVQYTDANYNGNANIVASSYPAHGSGGSGAEMYTNENNHLGVAKTFNRILNDFTATTGTAVTPGTGGTAGATLTGWNGNGAKGVGSSSATTGYIAGYGAGGGGVIGAAANTLSAGGAAAANSGAGGGGAAARTAATSMVNQLANGGAGGSGVIFLGYWA
jgi:hypothetical protein